MNEVALQWGPLVIKWYSLFLGGGLLFGYLLARKIFQENGFDRTNFKKLYLMVIAGILIGARIFEILIYHPTDYWQKPLQILYLWNGGMASHGAIIGGTLAAYWYCRKKGWPFWKLSDWIIIPVALASGFVRIGNFLNNEIVGTITQVPWAVKFSGYEGLRHPVQLYEAVSSFFITSVLYVARNKNLPSGTIFWSFMFFYPLFRFFIEFFKDHFVLSFGLTLGQVLCLIFMVPSGIMFYLVCTKKITLK